MLILSLLISKESIYTIYRNRGLRVLYNVILISGSPLLACCGALPGGERPARVCSPDIILAYLGGDGEWGVPADMVY